MKFFKTRLAAVILTVVVTSMLVAGVTYAASFSKDLPAQGTVIVANPDFAFFSDAEGTVPLTTLTFPDVIQGESASIDVYIKNTGNKAYSLVTGTVTIDPAIGTMVISDAGFPLPKGAINHNNVTFTPKLGGTTGPITATLSFSGTY